MEKFDLENFPTSESAKKMLSYVSDGFYDKSYIGKWIYQVMGAEYDKALEIVEDLPAQFFPETATWGLMYHEIKWGLPVRPNLSYEERRRLIYQKRDYKAPMAPYHMEKYLKEATGINIHVYDIHDPGDLGYHPDNPNIFLIGILEDEKTNGMNYDVVIGLVKKLKQSHTVFIMEHRLEFRYYVTARMASIRFRFAFYPRFNLPRLCLDGTWKLDGSQQLSGYNGYGAVDLYPVRIRIQSGVRASPKEETQISFRQEAREQVKVESRVTFKGQASARPESAECIGIRTEASHHVAAGDITIRNESYLDGTWKLDGSRKLNGGVENR